MIITDEYIREAEKFLINGERFDDVERIPFIKKLDSCDLLAVPGSGKTTALLAKLYCLSKNLPFEDGSGILVLSHTNAAVNEIEKSLKPYCPKLFEYPNFVGTVQSFVNRFLANPACFHKYGSYITFNDNDIYDKEAIKLYTSLKWSKRGIEPKNLINKLFGIINAGQTVDFHEGCTKIVDFLKNFNLNIHERKIIYNNRTILKYDSKNRNYYESIEAWKISLLNKGILNYYDSYNIANLYLNEYPQVKSIFSSRFKYVFIDEMQDLEKFQIDIIDKIFLGENSPTVIQRIGDINQAIYNSGKKVKVEADWIPRNQMYLNGSNRLTPEIANLVNCFTLDRQEDEKDNPRFVVNGLRQLETKIPPYLILFDEKSKNFLESEFKKLIQQYSLQKAREGERYGFKIIGWNAKWDDDESNDGKLRLENIFESYNKETQSNKEIFDSLSKYLQLFDHEKSTLEATRKSVLNSLIHILRIENRTYAVKIRGRDVVRYFSKSEMIKYIKKEENHCNYELFKSKVYQWSFDLATKKNYEVVYNSAKSFITTEFKEWFELMITQETLNFIGNQFECIIVNDDEHQAKETDKDDSIKVEIGTVHSAKGQTHCATMYVETSYYNYETEKLKVVAKKATKTKSEVVLPFPLLKQKHAYRPNRDVRAKEALKMMYVGFSRPTHLLCFACLKKNITDDLEAYRTAGWEWEDLTSKN